RRVAQSCVYGVDLNPLAVDLAKLSLWLATVAKDRPLSFLDHHLRCGNSLVGSRISELEPGGRKKKRARKKAEDESAQLSMLDDDSFRLSMGNAVGSMWLIEESPADTVEEVREQERLYEKLRADLTRRYARLADLAAATHFGDIGVDATLWKPLADYVAKPSAATLPQFQRWLDAAERESGERRFFHWELEFPEVFFDKQGRPLGDEAGFDVVVGNPPYVRQESLGREMKGYFEAAYPETYHGVADLFVYFFGQGIRQLRRGGRLSYISANSWLRANFAGPLRNFLRRNTTVEELIDLGDNHVFADAPDLYPAIHIVRYDDPPDEHIAEAAVFTRGEGLSDFEEKVADKLFPLSIHDQPDAGWQIGDAAGRTLFTKLMAAGKPLGEVIDGKMYRGVLTGFNEAFVIDGATRRKLIEEDPASEGIIKPIVRGEDLRPWYQEDEGKWLIVSKSSGDHPWPWAGAGDEAEEIFRRTYPAIHSHLASFEERLRKRSDKGHNWWELRSCDYYGAFEEEKIFWPDIAKLPRFSLGGAGVYAGNTCYLAALSSRYMLGILASRALWFALTQLGQSFGERAGNLRYRLFAQSISRLPIPDASDDDREAIGSLAMRITDEARARYALHERTRRRVHSDLGSPEKKLNKKLTSWWDIDFPTLRSEIKKVFKKDIPLAERDEWEDWLEDRRSKHERHTAEIVRLETELNARVYDLFGLGPEEIEIIEETTKYRYGEV
ncbi:MAG: Eco57I restriction-modification methylase domain-containing protein, partial [Rubrobacter sp.]|nr:Eco57I restriction-modification methylase domain-containing protein [Rubrobacter sp.]